MLSIGGQGCVHGRAYMGGQGLVSGSHVLPCMAGVSLGPVSCLAQVLLTRWVWVSRNIAYWASSVNIEEAFGVRHWEL